MQQNEAKQRRNGGEMKANDEETIAELLNLSSGVKADTLLLFCN